MCLSNSGTAGGPWEAQCIVGMGMWSKPTIAKIKGPQPRCCNGWGCSQNKLLICGTLLWGHHNACPDSGCHHQPGCCHHPPLGPKINLIQLQKDQQIRTSSKQLAPQAQRVVLRPHSPLGRGSHWLACIGCWTEALISVLGGLENNDPGNPWWRETGACLERQCFACSV